MSNDRSARPRDLIESVDHALHTLTLLAERRELRVTGVAEELGVARSTAHRILSSLAWRGFVVQDRVTRSYRAGTALIELGLRSVNEFDLRAVSIPHLERLSTQVRETVNLGILVGGEAHFIGGVECNEPDRTRLATGLVLPAYASSVGKVLLAQLQPGELRALYPRGLKRVTDHTQRTLSSLRNELSLIRSKGYAMNDGESAHGLRAIAAPVRDRLGRPIAAVAVSTPASRFGPARVGQLVRALMETTTLIRNDLPIPRPITATAEPGASED